MILYQIAAVSADHAIGKDNDVIWRYKEDLQFFKRMTLNKIVITGRKNFDSIVKPYGKPLPLRFHIVISTRSPSVNYENVIFVSDISKAYAAAQELIDQKLYPDEVFIIGGAEIYRQTLKDSSKLFLTRVSKVADGDIYYPLNYVEDFKLIESRQSMENPELTYEIWIKS